MRMTIDQPAKSTSAKGGRQNEAISRNGTIARLGEVDRFNNILLPTSATRNLTYTFKVTGKTPGFDPFLVLRIPATGRVFSDDDSGPGANALFRLTVNRDPQRRPVRVNASVSAFLGLTVGNYNFSVTP